MEIISVRFGFGEFFIQVWNYNKLKTYDALTDLACQDIGIIYDRAFYVRDSGRFIQGMDGFAEYLCKWV